MAQRRVFISHSARRDARANEVRQAIRAKLQADPDFLPLMDDLSLEPGSAWRSRINLWLAACDAAIVILSPDALTSSYVAYELDVLGFRRSEAVRDEREFLVIPIFVGVTADAVAASSLGPSQVTEATGLFHCDDADYGDRVLDALRKVLPLDSRPVERLARALERTLPNDDDAIALAAAALGVDLPFATGQSSRAVLAMQLLHAGMSDDAVAALDQIREHPKLNLPLAKEILSCSWVDLKAERLRAIVTGAARMPLLLNARSPDTAKMYIGAARHIELPPFRSHFTEPNLVIEERLDAEAYRALVIERVRQALLTELGETTDEGLATALSDYKRKRMPVFVALQEESPDPETLSLLRAKFEHATFFFLTGPKGGAGRLDPQQVYVIRPPLEEQDEDVCLRQYTDFCRLIDRR